MPPSSAPSSASGLPAASRHLPPWLVIAGCVSAGVIGAVLLDHFTRPSDSAANAEQDALDAVARAMNNTDRMVQEMNWAKSGHVAPDFELPDVETGEAVRLSSFRGRHVVLLFGSFTCDLFCNQARDLERIYQNYKDRAAFLFVYVGEPGHDIPELREAFARLDPGPAGRRERARIGRKTFGMTVPSVLDSDDLATMLAYEASPKRLVCLDADGRVVFDAGKGVPKVWDLAAVERYLDQWLKGPAPTNDSR